MYRPKIAALGGVGADKSFEQTVADLAHDFLNDKAPTLMKDELGFQLLDKSDDDTRGVGVCVFKPNGILMFAPVFFLNGEIKGHELLYLPEQDLFIPLKEAWINEILGKKPIIIGDSVDKGYQSRNGAGHPDMRLFRTPPKFASWINPLIPQIKKYMETVGSSLNKTASLIIDSSKQLADATSLEKFLKYASPRGLRKLSKLINKSLLTKRAFSDMYPEVNLIKLAEDKQSEARSKYLLRAEPTPKWGDNFFKSSADHGFVRIISYSTTITTGTDFDLSEKEKEKLLRDQYLVIDSRPDADVSVIEQKGLSFVNPSDSGIYSVLMGDGSYKDYAILKVFPVDRGRFFCDDHSTEYLVCGLDGHKGFYANNTEIFARKKYNKDKFDDWFKSLPACDNMSILQNSNILNFVDSKGTCYGDVDPFNISRVGDIIRMDNVEIGNTLSKKLKKLGGKLYVPSDCKVVVSEFTTDKNIFGTPELIEKAQRDNFENIKLAVANDWCKINDTTYPTKFAGFCALIKDYNLREKDAKSLFKQAEANSGNYYTVTARIKKADSLLDELKLREGSNMYFPEPTESSVSVLSSNLPAGPSESREVQSDNSYYMQYENPYNNSVEDFPAMEMQQIQNALQQGQDEVFNLSVLKQFLNDGDLSSEIDHEIPELIRGMNHAGQMLFRYYWKGDKFKELYGPQEMPELESSLRKIFELMGDVILLLKHKLKKDDTYGELTKINLEDLDS